MEGFCFFFFTALYSFFIFEKKNYFPICLRSQQEGLTRAREYNAGVCDEPPSLDSPSRISQGEGKRGAHPATGISRRKKTRCVRDGTGTPGLWVAGSGAPADRGGGLGRGRAPHGPARFPPREDLHFPRPQAPLARCFSLHFAGSGDPGPLLGPLVSRGCPARF